MGEKCCCCLPIDCGVKTLGVFVTLGAIALCGQAYAFPDYRDIFLPMAVSTTILALVWINAWINPTESSKNMLFLAYLVLMLVFNMGYQAYLTLNGKLADYNCRPDSLNQYNHDVSEIEQETDVDLGGTITREECIEKSGPLMWADFFWKLAFTCYFTFVIMKWTKHSDGYDKA